MVNKDILTPLAALFDRRNADLLILTLRFIRKIATVPVNWAAVPYEDIPPSIAKYIFRWGQMTSAEGRAKRIAVLREGLELLHVFAFHAEAIAIVKQDSIFEGLTPLVDIPELRSQLIRIFYRCSVGETSDEVFRRDKVVNMLITATTIDCDERMVALIILSKLSLDREISLSIGKSPLFTPENLKGMFANATTNDNEGTRILLTLISNVADNQPELVRGFDAEIAAACVQNRDQPILVEIFAIANRGKMNSDRAKFFIAQEAFVQVLFEVFANENAPPQLHLECVMFVSALVLYSAAAQALGKRGIVEIIIRVFLTHSEDLDVQAQALFVFFRLACHSETRAALLARPEVVELVIKDSISKNSVVNSIANSVLDAIVTFDRQSAERLRVPRFDAFNHEWLAGVASTDAVAPE
jgi:hypothetical protein